MSDPLGGSLIQELKKVEAERDRLKEKLEEVRITTFREIERLKTELEVEHKAAMFEAKDHDAWKAKAEKLADTLKFIAYGNCETPGAYAKAALEEYAGKPEGNPAKGFGGYIDC